MCRTDVQRGGAMMAALPVVGPWRKAYLWGTPDLQPLSPWHRWDGHVMRPYRAVRYWGSCWSERGHQFALEIEHDYAELDKHERASA